MPALVVPNAYLAVISGTTLGQPWVNVHGGLWDGPVLMDQTVADAIGAAWIYGYAQMNGARSTTCDVTGFTLQDLRTSTSASWDYVFAPFSGIDVDDALPPQLAICASHRTGLRGKSYNGRTYLPGYSEGSVTNTGHVDSAVALAIENAFGDIDTGLAAVAGAESVRAVVSRKLLVATPITSTKVDLEWDRQDRRKRT